MRIVIHVRVSSLYIVYVCKNLARGLLFSVACRFFTAAPRVCVVCASALRVPPRYLYYTDTLLPLRVPLVLTFSFLNIYINHFFAKNLDVGPCTNPYVGLPSPLFLWFLLSELRVSHTAAGGPVPSLVRT